MDDSDQDNTSQSPDCYFSVTGIPGSPVFQEVSGVGAEAMVSEDRASAIAPSEIKMPGIMKYQNVIMKRGIFVADDLLWKWFNSISMNTIARKAIVISMLDQTGNTLSQWTLRNAYPVRVTGAVRQSNGKQVAVESIEVRHEGLVWSHPA